MSNVKKWPAIDPEKVAKYKHIWENVSAADNLDPEVAAYLARVKEQGGGKGIEQMSSSIKITQASIKRRSRKIWITLMLLSMEWVLRNALQLVLLTSSHHSVYVT